jgi:hypothetical protein
MHVYLYLQHVFRWNVVVCKRTHERDWTYMWSYIMFSYALVGIIKHRMFRWSFLLQGFDVGPTLYDILRSDFYLRVRHAHWNLQPDPREGYWVTVEHVHSSTIEFLTSILIAILIREYPKYPHEPLFLFAEYQMCFAWRVIMTTSYFYNRYLNKQNPTSPPPPTSRKQLYFCSWVFHRWSTASAVSMQSEFVVSK